VLGWVLKKDSDKKPEFTAKKVFDPAEVYDK